MVEQLKSSRLAWLALGLVAGLAISGLLPQSPLHAVSTDRFDTFAVATGPVDEEVEGIYVLDFLTGELQAAVLSGRLGKFRALYSTNVGTDLGVDASKNPRYVMVTGLADLTRGQARMRPSRSVIYVAEVTTGMLCAYYIPWSREQIAAGQSIRGQLMPLDKWQFRTAAVRGS